MIIAQLIGGLGNQMFQYAAGRRLAIEKGTTLKLDIWTFEAHYPPRRYKLHHFNIDADIASQSECRRFTAPHLSARALRLIERTLVPRHRRRIYREQGLYQFDPAILNTGKDTYLVGYFQSEGYFKLIEQSLRHEFVIATPPSSANQAMADRMRDVNAVSLHIRRGDYNSNPNSKAYHGVLPLEYYHAAIDSLVSKVAEPHFFVFSDDPQWAHENLKLDYPTTLVDQNDAEHDYEDLRLMSLCQHHIIANSSFSWWGAWLCDNPNKIVYAPRAWLLDKSVDTSQVVPAGWIRL